MALKNPTRYVTVQRLSRFRQKLREENTPATVAEAEAAARELT